MIHVVLITFLLRLTMWGFADDRLPEGLRHMLMHVLMMPMAVLVVSMILLWPKFECFYFGDQWGKVVFFIFRETKQKAECTAFLEELVAQIETPGQILHEAAHESTGENGLRYRNETEAGWFWKAALGGGAAAAGFPLLPGIMQRIEPWGFFFVFGCAVFGAGMGVMSLTSKESMRTVAFLGIVFALIPVFFY